jgi:CRISPR-associated endonuclease/helicase Cas3
MAWEQSHDESPVGIQSAWLDGGPVTTVAELRDLSPGITVLLDEDLKRARAKPNDLQRLTLPMPVPSGLKWQQWPREKGLPVAPTGSIRYDRLRGAEWQKS